MSKIKVGAKVNGKHWGVLVSVGTIVRLDKVGPYPTVAIKWECGDTTNHPARRLIAPASGEDLLLEWL